ncbi:MAG: hypothetical protein U9R43_01480, partial [Thermodesulfobacteriota bacterium]|nr:hypothetical protein [Thermodesulfobacteriota bacterium]
MKLESRNSEEIKRVYELEVHKPAEMVSAMTWHDFDKRNKRRKNSVQNQKPITKARKDENTKKELGKKVCFVLSYFRVFVIKNKIRHNSQYKSMQAK